LVLNTVVDQQIAIDSQSINVWCRSPL